MALEAANAVMTQAPRLGVTPRSPAMAGMETLAMVMSSTCMNVASARAKVRTARTGRGKGARSVTGSA